MRKSKYITTTLPYSNGPGHIGHAFEFIIGDALSRYFKYNGCDVFFNLGLDEHGLKIQQTADKRGITPQEHVDEIYLGWKEFLDKLEINSWDSFYRTSDQGHISKVQQFWKELADKGDIYKKKYKGTYCVGCESYKNDRDLVERQVSGIDVALENPEVHTHKFLVCPDHPTTELQEIEEENYFFRLSKYRKELIEWFENSTDFLEPNRKRQELKGIIESIEDISISRLSKDVYWGTPVPSDEEHTVYVWLCALLNYIFAAGYFGDDDPKEIGDTAFDTLWKNSEVVQICGPDNLKFQAVIFQGLLASAGIKKSDKLLVHGTILDADGRKMSKTLGNVVDPIDQVNKYGVEAVRYYALAGITTYGNSKWSEERLVELYNSHLADDFGNLVSRVTHLAGKALEKFQDDPNIELDYSLVENDKWCTEFNEWGIEDAKKLFDRYKIFEALDDINKLVKNLNKRINDEKPWEDLQAGWVTILEIHWALNKINDLYYPVIPGKVGQIRKSLRECKKIIAFPKIELKNR